MLKQMKFISIFCLLFIFATSFAMAKEESKNATSPYGHLTGQEVLDMLKKNNELFQKNTQNNANVSLIQRQETAKGQHPYAIVVACSDSRTPPEHIFNAGLGELFVIRNAGNIINTNELGSIEYAVAHLNVKIIVVMGHSKCGAVGAAVAYKPDAKKTETQLQQVVKHIHENLGGEKDAQNAEKINVQNSLKRIAQDKIIEKYLKNGSVLLRGALYDVHTGSVEFFDPM